MRRALLRMAATLMTLSVSTAQAAAIVQTIPLSQMSGDFATDIAALPFDVTNGVLSDVSLTISGAYTPGTAVTQAGPTPPSNTDLITTLTVHAYGGPTFASVISAQTNVPVIGGGGPGSLWGATGAATFTFQTFDFGGLAAFAIPLSGPQPLANFELRTTSPLGFSVGDHTQFRGQAVLTYVFAPQPSPVPEPGTALLLAVSLVGLAGLRSHARS